MCGRLGLDVLAAPVCCSITERKRQRNRRAKISTRAADPAMGWTSPLPAVRMRAAMLVSAVVATCRGRRRRGAMREVCWLHGWVRFQPLIVVNATVSGWHQYSNARAGAQNDCDAFLCRLPGQASRRSALARVAAAIGPRPRRLAHGLLPGPADFKPNPWRRPGLNTNTVKRQPHTRRRAAATMHR